MSRTVIVAFSAFAFGVLVSAVFPHIGSAPETASDECRTRYPLLAAGVDCGDSDAAADRMTMIENETKKVVERAKEAGRVTHVSVFFRDLGTRRWFGIDEATPVYPASLAKLPIAMMTYKIAEVRPDILDMTLPITEDDLAKNTGRRYADTDRFEAGKPYPVRELVHGMLVRSDNAPVDPIVSASDLFRDDILSDLGIYRPDRDREGTGAWQVDARNYANLFRVLYNASYLRPAYSNEILSLLSESDFRQGLVSGVPDGTEVAHKYGEAAYPGGDGNTVSVLNDCSIVYRKEAPYILCIMTEGKDLDALETVLRDLSKTVHDAL